jgi:predicted nucleic acid-binding protein
VTVVLDTSVLIEGLAPAGDEPAAISVVSLAELRLGVGLARDPATQEHRRTRLRRIEAAYVALPVDADVAHEWGRLATAVAERGGGPRRRAFDLLIAATARAHGATLVTDDGDLDLVADLVRIRRTA